MIDSVQLVLLLVIIVLTILLVVLGIQVFFILKEVRITLHKTNKVLDTASSITESVATPISSIAQLVVGLRSGSIVTVAKFIRSLIGNDDEDEFTRRKRE